MPVLQSSVASRHVLRGVVPASFPALVGSVLFDASAEMPVAGQTGFCAVGVRIVRSAATGLLLFAYRMDVHGGDWDVPMGLGVVFEDHSAQLSFADFRVDSAGVTAPNVVEFAANGDFTFRFDHGLRAGGGGRECFVATNAREWREQGGRLTVSAGMKSSVLHVPAPIGLPLRPVTMREQEPTAFE